MFPHVIEPFIANAPMFGTANAALAVAVTKAGGFGFIGGGFDFTPSSAQLAVLDKELIKAGELLGLKPTLPDQHHGMDPLPIGVGFLTFQNDNSTGGLVPLLCRHRPAAVWLFAQAARQHAVLISDLKSVGKSWGLKVFVQVGSIQTAVEAVQDGADVLVVQGSDAGGHQFRDNASIITLLPEILDVLRKEMRHQKIPVLAAGGISDGRGLAAALALGANGVVMGTRFVATTESSASEAVKSVIISTKDGGPSTVQSTLHDKLQGRANLWPPAYTGRAVISTPYKDEVNGIRPIEKIVEGQNKAVEDGDGSGMVVWAGTGIGLIDSVLSADDVIQKSRLEFGRITKSLDATARGEV